MKKKYIEIIWCFILGIFCTYIPFYNWKQLVNVQFKDSSYLQHQHWDYWFYVTHYKTDTFLWFIMGFFISGLLIWTLKTYLKKNKE